MHLGCVPRSSGVEIPKPEVGTAPAAPRGVHAPYVPHVYMSGQLENESLDRCHFSAVQGLHFDARKRKKHYVALYCMFLVIHFLI